MLNMVSADTQGLQALTIDNNAEEFLTLGYAGDAKLYVPVTSLHPLGATRARMRNAPP